MRQTLPIALALALLTVAVTRPILAQGSTAVELKLGLDHTKVQADKVRKFDESAISEILERRIAALPGGSGSVKVAGVDDIQVRVPLVRDLDPTRPGEPLLSEAQTQMLTRPGKIEFRSLEDVQTNLNPDGRYLINVLTVQGKTTLRFQDRQSNNRPVDTKRVVDKARLLLSNDDLEPNGAQSLVNSTLVRARLTEKASKRLEDYLRKPGRIIAVVLDGEVVAINAGVSTVTPRRKSKSKDRKQDEAGEEKKAEPAGSEVDIAGGVNSPEEAALLAGVLNSGVLPFPLTVRSQRVVAAE